MNDKHLLSEIVNAALEKKADDVIILRIREKSSVADYFVICSANTSTQTKAIADEIEKKMEENQKIRILHREGLERGGWILLDYGDIVVHIFMSEEREYYNLENYWGDAPRVELIGLEIEEE